MKKILSITLALIMLLSVMPVAYAAEDAVVRAYVDEAIKTYTYRYSSYEPSDFKNGLNALIMEINVPFIENTGIFVDVTEEDICLKEWMDLHKEDLPAITEMLKDVNAAIEEKMEKCDATIRVNSNALIASVCNIAAFYYVEEYEQCSYYVGIWYGYQKISPWYPSPDSCETQAEYDEAIKDSLEVFELVKKHLDGEHDEVTYRDIGDGTHKAVCGVCEEKEISAHTFSVYVSNNDATEEADGTKTATCEFCGATDTVTDEGSKIVNNKDDNNADNNNSNCSCNCHKKGFSAFIWKILCFFYKIFGMNRTCACGVAHY